MWTFQLHFAWNIGYPEASPAPSLDSMSLSVHAYNCTEIDVSSFSKYFLTFGRHSNLLVDMQKGRQLFATDLNHIPNFAENSEMSQSEKYNITEISREKAQWRLKVILATKLKEHKLGRWGMSKEHYSTK